MNNSDEFSDNEVPSKTRDSCDESVEQSLNLSRFLGSSSRISNPDLASTPTKSFIADRLSDEGEDSESQEESSSLGIPQLDVSMTPWRKVRPISSSSSDATHPARTQHAMSFIDIPSKFSKGMKNKADLSMLPFDLSSPLNSRPTTQNSLFSNNNNNNDDNNNNNNNNINNTNNGNDGNNNISDDNNSNNKATSASVSNSNEIELLQKQITNYKLQLRVLTEIIRQASYAQDETENNKLKETKSRKSFYNKILETLGNNEKLDELQKEKVYLQQHLENKNKELVKLKEELITCKNDFEEVLEEVNAFLDHSEVISQNIDNMLLMLLENMSLSPEEKDALDKACGIGSNFIDVKINALTSTLGKLLSDIKEIEKLGNSTGVDNDTTIGDSRALNSQLEFDIEDIHREYHYFLQALQSKLEKNSSLEALIEEKLRKQESLVNKMLELQHDEQVPQQYQNSTASSVDDLGKRSSLELSKSYQEHIENLNNLVNHYKSSLVDKDFEIDGLKEKLRHLNDPAMSTSPSQSVEVLKAQLREQEEQLQETRSSSEKVIEELEIELKHVNEVRERLQQTAEKLERDLDVVHEENQRVIENLNRSLNRAVRKSGAFVGENQHLHEQLVQLETQCGSLKEQNVNLQQQIVSLRRNSSSLNKFESEFESFKKHLLLHLENIFNIFDKILQKKSIDQAKAKLNSIEKLDSLRQFKATQVKLESLYVFIETAVDSIVEEHAVLLLKEKGRIKRASLYGESSETDEGFNRHVQLRIEELERKWIAERERRKLDGRAAEGRISQLEQENEILHEQIRELTKEASRGQ